jgi:hypothetical protein
MANRGDHDFGAYHDVDVDEEEQDYDTATQPTVAENVLYARGHTTGDDTYDIATASATDTYDVASSFGGFALDPDVLEAMENGGTIRRVAKVAKHGAAEPLYSLGGGAAAATVSEEPVCCFVLFGLFVGWLFVFLHFPFCAQRCTRSAA